MRCAFRNTHATFMRRRRVAIYTIFLCVSAISTHQSELDAGLMAQLAELQALAEHMWPSLKPSQGPSPRESGDYLSTTSLDAAVRVNSAI